MFTVDIKQQHNNICDVRISWFNENDILAQIGGLDIIWLQIVVLIKRDEFVSIFLSYCSI